MSETEKFTIDDAENDGLIKREVGAQMVSNLKRSAPKIWTMFEKVCDNQNRRPKEVLGDHALRSINNSDHSEMLADLIVDLSEVNQDQIRIEDAKFINTLTEELGLETEDKADPIEKLIQRRLEAKAGPMLPGTDVKNRGEMDEDVKREIGTIKERMKELQAAVGDEGPGKDSAEESKEVDDLFDENSGDESGDETDREVDDVEVEVEESEEPSPPEGEDSEVDVDEFLEEEDSVDVDVDESLEENSEGDADGQSGGEEEEEDDLFAPDGITTGGSQEQVDETEAEVDELVPSEDGVSEGE